MGISKTYTCDNCGYSVLTSAGLDWGFFAVTDTYKCLECEEIVDVPVGSDGKKIFKKDLRAQGLLDENHSKFYICPRCSSEKLKKWNKRTRPCPKCNSQMNWDKTKGIVLWD